MITRMLIHIVHILIIGGLFLYIGTQRENIPQILFTILFYLGFFIIFYHLFKLYGYLLEGKNYWVNLIHILIIGPLLVLIGYYREKTKRLYFELLLMLGFASIGYHGYYLYLLLN